MRDVLYYKRPGVFFCCWLGVYDKDDDGRVRVRGGDGESESQV